VGRILGGGSTVGDGGRFNKATGTWTPIAATGSPSPRGMHSAVWTGTEMVVWGGFDENLAALGSGSRYNPTTGIWTALPTASAPVARAGHSAVWTGTDMIICGGFDNDFTNLGDGARWNQATNTWSPLVVTGAPSPRAAHTSPFFSASLAAPLDGCTEHPISVSYGMLRAPLDADAIDEVTAPADIPGWPRFA